MAICGLESEGYAKAANWKDSHATCNGSFGVMQIGCVHEHTVDQLFNPEYNIRVAYELYKERGWTPWSTYGKLALR